MSSENPRNILRSYATQANWAGGAVTEDRLVPPAFTRIRTPFIQTWREDSAVTTNLDWNSQRFSIYLPESLRCIRAIFLKIDLPAVTNGYNKYPGLSCLKTLRLMSAGQEVYTCDVQRFLVDYCESLSEEQLVRFGECYLGKAATNTEARTVMIPILLPNSQYAGRNGHDTRGFGVWPAFLGHNRLELQLTMYSNVFPTAGTDAVASIASACSLMYHQVEMPADDLTRYSDLRGSYSIVNRRFTELTNGWQTYDATAASNQSVVRWTTSQPQGTCTELIVYAVPLEDDEFEQTPREYIRPNLIRVIADSVTQKELDGKHEIECELWSHGFAAPADFPSPGRMCFASHTGEISHAYSGGYNMTLASNIVVEVRFPVACKWKIVAVQHQRVNINADGSVRAFLE